MLRGTDSSTRIRARRQVRGKKQSSKAGARPPENRALGVNDYIYPMKILAPCLLLLLMACAGNDFDETAFPDDQQATEMAFRRMADHGEMIPVLKERQLIDGWQFHVSGAHERRAAEGPTKKVRYLRDASGINYYITEANSPEVFSEVRVGTYGFGRGHVQAIERDLVNGAMEVELLLTGWTLRRE